MDLSEKIFKAYDIRGTYPLQFNEQNIKFIVQAIFDFINADNARGIPLKIALGRDMRLSSPQLFEVAKQTLIERGADVVDIGLVSTPTLYFAVRFYNCDGGIQISASHNPKDYNGLKMVKNAPSGLIKIGQNTGMEEIKRRAISLQRSAISQNTDRIEGMVSRVETADLLDQEVANAKKIAGHPEISPFKIVADAANAMGATYLESLFKTMPGQLIKINFELDGTFPSHPPDPLIMANLTMVKDKVVADQADLGLATDGDGDRLMFIDEKGERVEPSSIIAIVARELLRDHPGEKILYDIRYMYTPKINIEEAGGVPVMTRVGHAFITQEMNEEGGIFGGESSGHNFFRDTGNAESQLPVILLVLGAMTREKKRLSALAAEVKRSYESEEINFRVENADELMEMIEKEFNEGEILKIDGVAISFPNWRFLVRKSNTEPILRLTVEELGANATGQRQDQVTQFINQHAKFVNERNSSH